MACEDLLNNYNNQVATLALRSTELAQAQAEVQQRQFAVMAQQMAMAMASMMLLNCLNGQGGLPGMFRQIQEALASPEKLQAKISELQEVKLNNK